MDRTPSLNAGSTLILAGWLVLTMLGTLHASPPISRPAVIAPYAWEATANGTAADVLIILRDQADLSTATHLSTTEERRRHVYDVLTTTALRSQAALRANLDDAGVDYRPFYIANMIALRGDRHLLTKLATRPDVARIVSNPSVRQALPEPRPQTPRLRVEAEAEWNVRLVRADEVWALGHTGEGIVVAGQDTGYDWDHPALIDQYRGYDGAGVTHDYNWHDAIHSPGSDCGADSPSPCDDNGHGTHTMGIMVGDDGGENRVGVAPGAQWIGCRNMDEGVGSPATYIECFEFFLAPYPVGGDPFLDGKPSLAPHVINNSWTCPPYEGCEPDTLRTVVENVRAAGILVVAAAGNEGHLGCGTVQDPPAIDDAVLSVGATDSWDVIAGFSSRGPVTVDGSGRRKPDVSAPGVSVRSTIPGPGYAWLSGTSMAAPHVAGSAALLWTAAPTLVGDLDATEEIIAHSARPRATTQGCGGDGPNDVPNNVYGWGVVDALAAVRRAWVPISNQAVVSPGFPARTVGYTLAVTNTTPFTLNNVTVADVLPLGASLARADEGYHLVDRTVSWSVPLMARGHVLTRTLEVALDDMSPGTLLVNDQYSVTADQLFGPVTGLPSEVLIPWRILLSPIFKDERMRGM